MPILVIIAKQNMIEMTDIRDINYLQCTTFYSCENNTLHYQTQTYIMEGSLASKHDKDACRK